MRTAMIVLALWTAANVVWTVRVARAPAAGTSIAESADGRTAVRLPIEGQDAVRAEMRLMLSSVQGVLDGVVKSDTAAIRRAAAASGVATAADPALEGVLPEGFMQYGMATHLAFDSLAANASAGPAAAIAGLAAITGTCVACHATYRLGGN